MQLFNLLLILNKDRDKVLFVKRSKEPYKGLFNLPGGKIENGEEYLDSAYRELYEETGISKKEILLKPFIDFKWHPASMAMNVFIGGLVSEVELVEEVDTLHWISISENFFDMTKFAGEGNIGHMIEIYKQFENIL